MFVLKKDYEKLEKKVEDLEAVVFNMGLALRKIEEANKKEEPTVYLS